MSDKPSPDAVARAVAAARATLSARDAEKLERLAGDRDSLNGLASSLSPSDWETVNKVLRDPQLLRRVLSSSKGKNALHEFLNRVP